MTSVGYGDIGPKTQSTAWQVFFNFSCNLRKQSCIGYERPLTISLTDAAEEFIRANGLHSDHPGGILPAVIHVRMGCKQSGVALRFRRLAFAGPTFWVKCAPSSAI